MPQQRICDNELPDGTRCRELATETHVQYVYRTDIVDAEQRQVLKEVRRTIHCPRCGVWTLVEAIDAD